MQGTVRTILDDIRDEGRVEGRQEGREESARKMLKKGFDNLDIMEITGVGYERLQELAAGS